MKYCGREFNEEELTFIRQLAAMPKMTRYELSQQVCQKLEWYKHDGGLKDMSCRVALIRMQEDGLIQLPIPRHRNSNATHIIIKTEEAAPQSPIISLVNELGKIHLDLVLSKSDSRLWNEYIDRYHYLGHKPLPGILHVQKERF